MEDRVSGIGPYLSRYNMRSCGHGHFAPDSPDKYLQAVKSGTVARYGCPWEKGGGVEH